MTMDVWMYKRPRGCGARLLCISECTCPSVCGEKFYFKRMYIFSLNGEVHFLS